MFLSLFHCHSSQILLPLPWPQPLTSSHTLDLFPAIQPCDWSQFKSLVADLSGPRRCLAVMCFSLACYLSCLLRWQFHAFHAFSSLSPPLLPSRPSPLADDLASHLAEKTEVSDENSHPLCYLHLCPCLPTYPVTTGEPYLYPTKDTSPLVSRSCSHVPPAGGSASPALACIISFPLLWDHSHWNTNVPVFLPPQPHISFQFLPHFSLNKLF